MNRRGITLIAALCLICFGSLAQDTLKVMTYNIWDGLEHKPDRRARFVEYIRQENPDILMLDELVELTADSLSALAKDCGYAHSAILKEEWYPVGVISRTPVEVVCRKYNTIEEVFGRQTGFWHGIMHVRTGGLDLIITHLSPFDWKFRLREAKQITSYIDSLGLKDYLVAGDLNSFSPYDADRMTSLTKWRRNAAKGDAKRPQWSNLNEEGMFDLTTQTHFLSHGLTDPMPLFMPKAAERVTHPTMYSRPKIGTREELAEIQTRIDYILLSPSLMQRCVGAQVVPVEGVSDHYPVKVLLKKNDWRNSDLTPAERAKDLVSKMTLEEKVAQIRHLHSGDLFDGQILNMSRLAERAGKTGRGFVEGFPLTAENCRENFRRIQKYLVDSTRLGIPAFIVGESLHGSVHEGSAIFPQNIALASTFNPELAYMRAGATSSDLRFEGINQVLSPCMDVVRDLRWGRVEETYGEDPYLNSIFAYNEVKGYLDNGIQPMLKHFGPHGNPSGGLNLAGVNCSGAEFRDVYMYPFEYVIRNLPVNAVMSTYNTTNGVPNSASPELLTAFLRDTLGFQGYVYSDWGAIEMLHTFHKTAPTRADAALQALGAGLDAEASSDCFPFIPALIEAGKMDPVMLDRAVERVLTAKFAAGLFEDPYGDRKTIGVLHGDDAVRLSRRIADESIILLKNEGSLLPLNADSVRSLAVIGPNADQVQFGDYSWSRSNKDGVTPLQALKVLLEPKNVKINYSRGADLMSLDESMIPEAVKTAENSDAAILFLGSASASLARDYSGSNCGEGFDLADLELTGAQQKLLDAVLETGRPVVLVLVAGKPFAIPEAKEKVPAIVAQWYAGERQGEAIADMLFGITNPSGHLTVSVPRSAGHLPSYYNHLPGDRGYYRAPGSYGRPGRDYVFSSPKPLWAFGHGLSYTDFTLSDLQVVPAEDSVRIKVTVSNTGSREGAAVPQLYVRHRYSSVPTPVLALKNFAKTGIEPGQSRIVDLSIPLASLSFTGADGVRKTEPGEVDFLVGFASDNTPLSTTVTIGCPEETLPVTDVADGDAGYKGSGKKINVRGQLRDIQATVIPGVRIHSAKQGKVLAVSGKDGSFSIRVADNDRLLMSAPGYADKTVYVSGRGNINVTLSR